MQSVPRRRSEFVELSCGFGLRTPVDFGYDERFLPIAVLQRLSHPDLARAVVVVPTVVEEIDPAIESLVDDAGAQPIVDMWEPQVPPTDTDRGYAFACSAKDSIRHVFADELSGIVVLLCRPVFGSDLPGHSNVSAGLGKASNLPWHTCGRRGNHHVERADDERRC
jgi:hypothetical protein